MFDLLADVDLPDTLRFLNGGWWLLHLVAIPTVFLIGFAIGGKRGAKTIASRQTAASGYPG